MLRCVFLLIKDRFYIFAAVLISDHIEAYRPIYNRQINPYVISAHNNNNNKDTILEHFMLPSADKLYGDADFIFQQDLAPAHTAKSTKSWLNEHGVVCLTGQQTHQTWT